MASGLVRVAVLLCAVVAVTRAQTWHSHGDLPGAWIQPALVPLTQYNGNIWFGVSSDGALYERYHDTGVWYWRNHGIPISSGQFPYSYGQYHEEPCALEGENEIHLMGTDGKLFGRYLSPNFGWYTTHHGAPFGFSDIIYASGCSSVKKPGLKTRIFMRGAVGQGAANGHLYEWFPWDTVFPWRWHGRPFTRGGSTYVANIKTTSYLASTNGYSYVFVVGTDGNMWQRVTSQNGWYGRWYNRGKPAGKTIRHIHATRYGLWWAITTDGSVCRFHGGWPCFPPPNGFVRDCSDPFYVGNGLRSMFCITDDDGAAWTPENSLYQFFVGWDPATAEWGEHGIPASNQYVYVDRPNVAFASNPSWPVIQTPKSVFVPSTEGVYEWR